MRPISEYTTDELVNIYDNTYSIKLRARAGAEITRRTHAKV